MKSESSPGPIIFHQRDAGKSPVIVIGIGNEYRGDDAVGILATRNLAGKMPPEIKTIELTGDQSDLLELMHTANAVIIVDAVRSAAPAGTIFRIDAAEESIPNDFSTFTTHSIDSVQAIELARSMNRLPNQVIVYGIVGKDFSFTSKITPQVRESIDVVRDKILNDLDSILKSGR